MVKNEEIRLPITLKSLAPNDVPIIDALIVYDTGSTDKTIEIVKEWSEFYKVPLHLKEGEFVNFSVSRNIALDFADQIDQLDYFLLMDSNDELRRPDILRKLLNESKLKHTLYMITQHLKAGDRKIVFRNFRLVKARSGWRYNGPVHEYLENGEGTKGQLPKEIELYQDRFADTSKTQQRFIDDKRLLQDEIQKNPNDSRSMFYLAQTCSGLGLIKEARDYYIRRTKLGGFSEEIWLSKLRIAILGTKLGLDFHYDVLPWIFQALEEPSPTFRSEPAVLLGTHYIKLKQWDLAYIYIKLACERSKPDQSVLFYDHNIYDYERWHLLGIVSHYTNQIEVGRIACEKAIDVKNQLIDYNNLSFYIKNRPKKFLVIGHPRCGSGYMAQYLRACGYYVGHEKMRSDGISCWMAANPIECGNFDPYWTTFRRSKTDQFEQVVYYIRDPKDALPSIKGENRDKHSFKYRKDVINYHFNVNIDEFNEDEQAIISLYYWDKLIETSGLKYLLIKVEEAETQWNRFTNNKPMKFPPKNVNSRAKNEYNINNVSEDVLKLLHKFRTKYNY